MKLYCVRHGEALSSNEHELRPLSKQGAQDVQRLADYLQSCGVVIPHILHSPKERAKQTAEFLGAKMAGPRVVEAEYGLDELDPIDSMLQQISQMHEDTMLVGHLPFMSQLVSALVMNDPDHPLVRFAPATVVCLEQHEAQRWIINWVISPQLLPQTFASDQAKDLF